MWTVKCNFDCFSAVKSDIVGHLRHLGGSIRLGAHGSGTAAGCGRHACSLRPRSDCSSLTRTIASIWSRLRYLPTCVEIVNSLYTFLYELTIERIWSANYFLLFFCFGNTFTHYIHWTLFTKLLDMLLLNSIHVFENKYSRRFSRSCIVCNMFFFSSWK